VSAALADIYSLPRVSGIGGGLRLAAAVVGIRRSNGVNDEPFAIHAARKQSVEGCIVVYAVSTLPGIVSAVLVPTVAGVLFAARSRLARLLKPETATMLDTEEYFHLALHASSMGDHHACMTYLEEVLQREPRNARAMYLRAVQHAELGLTQRAIAGIKDVLSIEPDMDLARFQLGLLLLFDVNQPAEAKDYLLRLCCSQDRALRAYSVAMIALVDNEPTLARQHLAIGLSESSPDSQLPMLMRRLFELLLSGPGVNGNGEPTGQRSIATCPPSLS
jgi:tetratricopeptide (TPR) repeat protein